MRQEHWRIGLLIALAAAGTAAAFFLTSSGAGITPDSVSYVATARNLQEGHGFARQRGDGNYVPVTNWPPFFPAVLVLAGLGGTDPLVSARTVNSVLLGLNTLLVGLLVYRRTTGSLGASAFASLLMLSLHDMLKIHVMIWSEPLFLSLTLIGLFALAHYLGKPAWRWLAIASLATAAAFLTRYVGIALVATGCLALLLWSGGKGRQKLRDCLAFGVIACLPAAVWMARNVRVSETATNREFRPRLIGQRHLFEGLQTVRQWIVPRNLPFPMRYIVIGALLAGAATYLVLLLRRRPGKTEDDGLPERPAPLLRLLLLFVVMYVGALVCAMLLAHPSCDLGARFLSPVVPVLVVLLTCAVHDRLRPAGCPLIARAMFAALCAVLVASSLLNTVPWALRVRQRGMGFVSPSWRRSETIAKVADLPPRIPIYSNRSDAIYILTGRPGCDIPKSAASEEAQERLTEMRERLQAGNGVVVFFARVDRPYLLSEEELREKVPLRRIFRGEDGTIYRWDGEVGVDHGGVDSAAP